MGHCAGKRDGGLYPWTAAASRQLRENDVSTHGGNPLPSPLGERFEPIFEGKRGKAVSYRNEKHKAVFEGNDSEDGQTEFCPFVCPVSVNRRSQAVGNYETAYTKIRLILQVSV